MQQIGRYQVLGELGRGAMGVVYRALDPSIGRTVAIKTIRLKELVDPAERARLGERLLREAQSAGILSHPNIVTIYDVGEEDNVAYIAMEYVDGPTLERLLHTAPPNQALILTIIQQTGAALDYAHKRGIVHRDIKPANIMIHEGSVAKITDFGVAKIQSHQMTQWGTILGTPNYMSPEQIQGHVVDGAADQFSLAVIAYELLTGEKPFAGESLTTLLFRIVKEEPEPPQRINPSLGWPVDTVLKKAMAKSPGERYATCSDFATAFTNACNASKGWHPLPPGGRQNLPTIFEPPRREPPVVALAPAPDEAKSDPKLLRTMRTLAVVILSAGVAGMLMVGGYNYFNGRDSEVPASQIDPPPPVFGTPRPSPMEKPAEPAVEKTPEQVKEKPAPVTVRENRPQRETETAEYPARLVTNPPGATLMVDSKPDLTCKTPCSISLAAGRHTLASEMPGYRRGLRIFELPKESEIFMNLEATTGTIMIRSEPPGGAILIDGHARGEKTPALIRLPTGQHKIEVEKEGFRNYSEVLDIKDSVITNIDVSWTAKP